MVRENNLYEYPVCKGCGHTCVMGGDGVAGGHGVTVTGPPVIHHPVMACHPVWHVTYPRVPTDTRQSCLSACYISMHMMTVSDLHKGCSNQDILVAYLASYFALHLWMCRHPWYDLFKAFMDATDRVYQPDKRSMCSLCTAW